MDKYVYYYEVKVAKCDILVTVQTLMYDYAQQFAKHLVWHPEHLGHILWPGWAKVLGL